MLGLLVGILASASQVAAQFEDLSFAIADDDVRIIGRDASDEIGSALAVGNVNGDEFDDILIGAPRGDGRTNNRDNAGEVAVILGRFDLGNAGETIDIRNAARTFYGATIDARLGHAVAVGDMNGDTIGDIIMGAPEAVPPSPGGEGAVYVFYGANPLGGPSETELSDVVADIYVFGVSQNGRFGNALAVGDFNADGIDDVAIAAPREGDSEGRIDAGNVYILFGRQDFAESVEFHATVATIPDRDNIMQIRGPTALSIAGQALAVGDVNVDGKDDLIIGAPRRGEAADILPGEVYVVFGGTVFEPGSVLDLALETDLRVIGPLPEARFGITVAAGDINGNSATDLLIGAPKSRFNPPVPVLFGSQTSQTAATGHAYAIFGGSFAPGSTIDLRGTAADVTLAGPEDQADLGRSLAAGDINGDGIDDWMVGAPGADRRGQVYRVPGRSSWPLLGAPGAFTMGARNEDGAGTVIAMGDLNADQLSDLVMSSPGFDDLTARSGVGAVYVVLGVPGPAPIETCTDQDGDGFNAEGSTCGPFDCDDTDDTIHPLTLEICGDGIDNNCNGIVDGDAGIDNDGDGWPGDVPDTCVAPDCNDNKPAINPGADEDCFDSIDNDCDGLIDGADPECVPCDPTEPEDCTDGIDNDCDFRVDQFDTDCNNPVCTTEVCDDGKDNDCDGLFDAFDTDCGPGAGCPATETSACSDGLDNDCDGVADQLDADCDPIDGGGCKPGSVEVCGDGQDNDCDGAIDLADTECREGPIASSEICSNCVDDDGNGLMDMLDPACTPTPLVLESAVVKRSRKFPTLIKKVLIKTGLPSAGLLSSASVTGTTDAGTAEANVQTPGVVVGVAFDDGSQFCMTLDQVKQKKRGSVITFKNTSRPSGKLRIKRRNKGDLKIKYKQTGKFELPESTPAAMAFGIFSAEEPYSGVARLEVKSAAKLVGAPE